MPLAPIPSGKVAIDGAIRIELLAVLEAVAHAPALLRARLGTPSGGLKCVQSPCTSEVVKEFAATAGAALDWVGVRALLTVAINNASAPRIRPQPLRPRRP